MPDLVEVSIRWRGDGDNVKVAGEFNNWTPQDLTRQEDGTWIVKMSLAPGKYMYKFVVGGDWLVNQDMPTVSDAEGNKNNQIEVEDGEASGDSDSWEKVSIPEAEAGEAGDGAHSVGGGAHSVGGGAHGAGGGAHGAGAAMQRIVVVERIFSLGIPFDETVEALKENNATMVEEKTFNDVYYDTEDYVMLRKGMWLRNRVGGAVSWQLRAVVNQELKICDDKDDVTRRLEVEIDEKGSLEDIVKKLQEMVRVTGKVNKWTMGETEIEIKKEGKVETALVRVVGDIVTALKDLETSADKLKLVAFQVASQASKLTGAA